VATGPKFAPSAIDSDVRVLVLTTSYPRDRNDPAGRFVADAVEQVRERGVTVDVVSPASFRHFGLAYGHGIVGNLRVAALAHRARTGIPVELPPCCAPAGRPRARALAGGGRRRHDARHAVRRSGVGDGPRARASPSVARAPGAAASPSRDRGVSRTRRRGASPGSAGGADRPERSADSGDRRAAGGAAARALRRPALGGEGRAGARRGGARSAAAGRGRRAAAIARPGGSGFRAARRARAVVRARSRRGRTVAA